MTPAQAHALAHPLDSADPTAHDIAAYRTVRLTAEGQLAVILAVDR